MRMGVFVTLLIGAYVPPAALAAGAPDAQQMFRHFGDRGVQVRILDRASGSKSTIGSGFFVDAAGHLITNFHVISALVHHPERVHAEIVEESGASTPVELVNFDVVHDLAILSADRKRDSFFKFATQSTRKGTRLYSLGNPYDLGSSIVEGTYNGLLENSLYEKIHFTGAINPGMSGGPTIDAAGKVVGINVSTAGNELSFLVPAKYAARLLAQTLAPAYRRPENFLTLLDAQLLQNQADLMERLLGDSLKQVSLGEYRLPSEVSSAFKCWGNTDREEGRPYEIVNHQCSTEDEIYVADGLSSGAIHFQHSLVSSGQLNVFQFFSLYEDTFKRCPCGLGGLRGNREHVGQFACTTDFVDNGRATYKAVLCLRAYKRLPGLYDAVFKAASLNNNHSGVQTTLTLSGMSYENATLFARRYLEAISWSH